MSQSRNFWRVMCQINHHPGQWHYWYREQCCAVGWHPPNLDGNGHSGWEFNDFTPNVGGRDWATSRNALHRMQPGDYIIASMPGNKAGRAGEVTRVLAEDHQWNPIIKPRPGAPFGENGRRIEVRWDLTLGPEHWNQVVLLPESARWGSGAARGTVRRLDMALYEPICSAMADEYNWVSLASTFAMENALSDYIAANPSRLGAGLVAHPSINVREESFPDRTRADVVLQNAASEVVVVECKQGVPTTENIDQLLGYIRHLADKYPHEGKVRGILVHGVTRRVSDSVRRYAKVHEVALVHHELSVAFANSG